MSEVIENVEVTNDEDGQYAEAKASYEAAKAAFEAVKDGKRKGFLRKIDGIEKAKAEAVAKFDAERRDVEAEMIAEGFDLPNRPVSNPKLNNEIARKMDTALQSATNKRMTAHSLYAYVGCDRQAGLQILNTYRHHFSRGGSGIGAWVSLKGHEPRNGDEGSIDQTDASSKPNIMTDEDVF